MYVSLCDRAQKDRECVSMRLLMGSVSLLCFTKLSLNAWVDSNTAWFCVWIVKQGLERDKLFPTVQCTVQDAGRRFRRGGDVHWRPWGGCVRVEGHCRSEEVERAQFTVWLCPLSSEWSVAARGPAWSRRSPWSVVAPALSSPLSLWPVWPAAPLF